ncbi:Hsp70 suppressor, GTPase facilitates ribosomal subunit dissociation [Tulasnella sp. 419]|nr:Hsp70 suppressor, GTPase facilitates ribosomal subunit dissociation [Tulasnella sp. 419]
MSRHRFVRNINIHEELDDTHYDEEDPFDGITPEQQAQLDSATDAVTNLLGPEKDSLISVAEIRHTLWDNYFDVDETLEWAFEEQKRRKAAKEKKEKKKASSGPPTRVSTPTPSPKKAGSGSKSGAGASGSSTPLRKGVTTNITSVTANAPLSKHSIPSHSTPRSQLQADMDGLNLGDEDAAKDVVEVELPPPKMSLAKEKVLEEARKALEGGEGGKKALSLVVIGHVDAGKSTLMGRLLYELGQMEERKRRENERESSKVGKGSFSWAWEMDGLGEERERGVTIDITQTTLALPTTNLTILDAPGHRDFIPNMISGASQADAALLVVDATVGEFEAGFAGGGQSREHVILVRSLGVGNIVIAVNKLDMVDYSQARYDEICSALKPFLVQSGYPPSKTIFVPCAAMAGVNLLERASNDETAKKLAAWYDGPTLVDSLDKLTPPARPIDSPLRFPVSNVFKGGGGTVSSGIGVSGRLVTGVVQVGEKVRILPGDETAVVRTIEYDEKLVPWAAAGSNITLYLANVDPLQLSVGSVLCPPTDIVPLASSFVAQVIVFDVKVPITAGAAVELFHHSRDNPATITKLVSILDRSSGAVIKERPRVLAKSSSAIIHVSLRSGTSLSGAVSKAVSIPIEPFSVNKEMGRILLRRGGETIAAGIVTEIIS